MFDVIEYLSGLTGFVFDRAVLNRIALERECVGVTSFDDLSQKTRDLLLADLLYTAYMSPNVMASRTAQHGGFTNIVGSQTVNSRDDLYRMFIQIYKKYNDARLSLIPEMDIDSGNLQWI